MPERGREIRDISIRSVLVWGVAFVALCVVTIFAMKLTFDWFAARETRRQEPPASLARTGAPSRPPEPRLAARPFEAIEKLRATEDASLNSYEWVDRDARVVRIPVDRAITILSGEAP